jgi:hypothetical protein
MADRWAVRRAARKLRILGLAEPEAADERRRVEPLADEVPPGLRWFGEDPADRALRRRLERRYENKAKKRL